MSARPPLEEMTLRQLRRVASELSISRYSRMRKDQLFSAIREIQQRLQIPSVASRALKTQAEVEAAKFDVGQVEFVGSSITGLTAVDEVLPELPNGYGEGRIVLMSRDPEWAYAYWDIPNESKEALRRQGGVRLGLRFYDVTDINLEIQRPHSLQQYECDELAREWYLPVPVSDRDYMIEIGYITAEGRWLRLAQSATVRIPPVYPSDWIDDQFVTIDWDEDLRGKTFLQLAQPGRQLTTVSVPVRREVFAIAEAAETHRVVASVPDFAPTEAAISSYVFPAGMGQWASGAGVTGMSGAAGMSSVSVATMSGVGMSGVGMSGVGMSGSGIMSGVGTYTMSGMGMSGIGFGAATTSGVGMSGIGFGTAAMSGVGIMSGSSVSTMSGIGMMSGMEMMSGVGMYTMSGAGMSGVGMSGIGMSGAGFSASAPPIRPRKFWMIADAELIVYGATEPDATVTIGGRPIKIGADGTFRFQISFQDGEADFPIMAVAADGEQMRSIHLKFNRETLERRTNVREEAVEEWLA